MRKLSFLVAAVFFVSLFLANSCQSPSSVNEPLSSKTAKSSSSNKSTSLGTTTGFLRLLLTDAPAEEAENIFVTVDLISVHKEGGSFFTVSEVEQQFDLKALEGQLKIILTTPLESGNYTQIRMRFVQGIDGEGNFKSRIVFSGLPYPLDVPSDEIKIPVEFKITGNETTEITLDFDAAESIHIVQKPKKDDTYILRPVIQVVNMQNSDS
jgi:hypothetical protein